MKQLLKDCLFAFSLLLYVFLLLISSLIAFVFSSSHDSVLIIMINLSILLFGGLYLIFQVRREKWAGLNKFITTYFFPFTIVLIHVSIMSAVYFISTAETKIVGWRHFESRFPDTGVNHVATVVCYCLFSIQLLSLYVGIVSSKKESRCNIVFLSGVLKRSIIPFIGIIFTIIGFFGSFTRFIEDTVG